MDFSIARRNMVNSQIRPNQVNDERVLDAMMEVPREVFLAGELKGVAYVDEDLPVADGRYLMEPIVLARLLQAAAIGPNEVVLDVGCGTGYSAALLARLASTVVGIESDARLAQRASETLVELGIDTVAVVEGELAAGYAKQAPFEVIFFDGAVTEIPATLAEQLSEGGRLVAVVKPDHEVGVATLVIRRGGRLSQRPLFDANIPYLPGFEPKPAFIF